MNLLNIGNRTINLDLVAVFEGDWSPPGEVGVERLRTRPGTITVVLALGGNHTFEGVEAEALRRFLAQNSRPLLLETELLRGGGDFAVEPDPPPTQALAPVTLQAESARREEGC